MNRRGPVILFLASTLVSSAANAAPGEDRRDEPSNAGAAANLADESGGLADVEHMRTKVEWLAARSGGGNAGFYLSLRAFTLRWTHFYWSIARGTLLGIYSELAEKYVLLLGGTTVGIPWHVDSAGLHELRFGLGLEVGSGKSEVWEGSVSILYPIVLAPEIYYVWHFLERFAFVAGIDCHYAPIEKMGEVDAGSEYEDWGDESGEDRLRMALPAFNAFVGVAF